MVLNEEIASRLSRIESMLECKLVQQYFTIQEAAELLRCSRTTIRRMMADGSLQFSRLNGSSKSSILFRRRDLLKSVDGV
ncbi:MAG: helix-turn-helix domain-containing protein [Candidatus Marinimicrobia bacterium]|nr:helix-turn-helix domain-containing protein [Candidatus Neomarinimicrobiota bacterium]MBT4537638.1 helix-turn-helix domain-containing protein [Candidatus Neomarinimicrobiota bacterium]MBT7884657.1 helix-turn-helix domain-containing protein [Candidatus Neomarinimicrobiota bacterium]